MLCLKTPNCHGLCFISPFIRGNLYLSRGLCGRLLHAIFSRRTRSGSSLSLDGKVRGQRMTTDRSCSPSDLPAVSAVSFILPPRLFSIHPSVLVRSVQRVLAYSSLFPSIMKISQETQRGLLTFIGPVHYRHACLLFRKMPGHTLLPGAIWLSDCSGLSACRSIPCVNNLSPSDAAEDGERGNKQQSL